jgi:SAM-dependent methyltransferase
LKKLKHTLRSIPVAGPAARKVWLWVKLKLFPGSGNYWESRYVAGDTSGCGSYGRLAEFKAETVNRFVDDNTIQSVIEFGCGDGNQLSLARYPKYIGLDVSPTALKLCAARFAGDPTKRFLPYEGKTFDNELSSVRSELALSLDVVYHLVEDEVFNDYMRRLFCSAERFVIIYSSNTDENSKPPEPHIRHRRFTSWIDANQPDWTLVRHIPNPFPYQGDFTTESFADVFVYGKRTDVDEHVARSG